MIRNLFLIIIIFSVLYILAIFKAPIIAWAIEDTLHVNWFNNFILWLSDSYNKVMNKIPTAHEIQNSYNTLHSWAIDFKNTVINGVDYTQDKIDKIRGTLSWVEDTYNDIKDWVNDVKVFIDNASWAINNTKHLIENVSEITETLNNTWETN
jgi:hypothetical protein